MDRATTIGSRPPVNFNFSHSLEQPCEKGTELNANISLSLSLSLSRELLYTESTRIELLSIRNAIPLTLRPHRSTRVTGTRTTILENAITPSSRLNKRVHFFSIDESTYIIFLSFFSLFFLLLSIVPSLNNNERARDDKNFGLLGVEVCTQLCIPYILDICVVRQR